MKHRKKTMKNDEKERTNTEKWWTKGQKTMKHDETEKKLWKMMKTREHTMKHDEKERKITMKNDEKERKNNENRLKIWKKTMKNDEQ